MLEADAGDDFAVVAALGELRERIVALQETVARIEGRLEAIEAALEKG